MKLFGHKGLSCWAKGVGWGSGKALSRGGGLREWGAVTMEASSWSSSFVKIKKAKGDLNVKGDITKEEQTKKKKTGGGSPRI